MRSLPVISITIFLILVPVLFTSCQKVERAKYPSGQLKYELPKNSDGALDGTAKWWYPDGKIQLSADYLDGELNGKLIRYYDNGNLESEEEYSNGQLNGISRQYTPQGKISADYTYRNDTLNGPSKIYSDMGQVLEEGHYKDGYFHGTWAYYDRFGNLSGEADFVMGKGLKKTWTRGGKLAASCEYEDNLKHGKEYYYNIDGQPVKYRLYEAGEVVIDSNITYQGW